MTEIPPTPKENALREAILDAEALIAKAYAAQYAEEDIVPLIDFRDWLHNELRMHIYNRYLVVNPIE